MLQRIAFLSTAAFLLSSCLLYDQGLLDEAEGVASSASPQGQPGSPASEGTGGSAGPESPTQQPSQTGGGSSTDGGNGDGDEGTDTGTGGMEAVDPCDAEAAKGEIKGLSNLLVFDEFDTNWRIFEPRKTFDGEWFLGADMSGKNLAPSAEEWSYAAHPCAEDGDTHLHITGKEYDNWGLSLDAQLLENREATNGLEDYQGLAFMGRSELGNQIQIHVSHGVDDSSKGDLVVLDDEWEQHELDFPGDVDMTAIRTVHLVVLGAAEHDLYIDDLTFFGSSK